MTHPKFIGIGAPRAGTTWLHTVLTEHPDIALPILKELHYFDVIDPTVNRTSFRFGPFLKSRLKHNLGAAVSSVSNVKFKNTPIFNPSWDLRYFSGKFNDEWYQRLFRKEHNLGLVTGEITPSYSLLSPEYIRKILSINNDMKFIYILRDPIDRSWSHAVKMLSRDKGVPLNNISVKEIEDFFQSNENINCGSYAKNIKKYLSVIDSNNLLVIYFDDIKINPESVLNQIYSFLNISKTWKMKKDILSKPVNSSSIGYKIPDVHVRFLSKIFHDDIEELCDMYSGWPDIWLERIKNNL